MRKRKRKRPVDIVHHLYVNPGDGLADMGDLLPYCGTIPGPDHETGDWNTGHPRDMLLECSALGLVCCSTCLSPAALGGWTPMIIDDVAGQAETGVDEDHWWA
ncbi:MAG: hypothetical protein ACTH2Q_01365 [Propionibacteriaceae bacterium]